MEAKVHAVIAAVSDAKLATVIVDAFKEVEKNFYLKSWKTSELDAGHFVEGIRRLIEHRLFGAYTPVGTTLPTFGEKELKRYENVAGGNESYRLHIPRVLFGVYGIRNKRGVGHVGHVAPNYMDATYVLGSCKWVLAEVTRLESGLSADETVRMIDKVVERNIEGIWEDGGDRRILAKFKSLDESILFALFDRSPSTCDELFRISEYSNRKYFDRRLQGLHEKKFLTVKPDGHCVLSPIGRREAERIISAVVI